MNFQNDRYILRFANHQDNDGMREIFERERFDGGIGVQYLRNPMPYESFSADGDTNRIMVITDHKKDDKIVAIGGAVIRSEYVNGNIERCAYLTGLKIHPDYQKKIFIIAKAYEFLHKNLTDCYCCYTTILDDNVSVIKMLEKKRNNMPEYRYIGHYTTYCFHGGKKLLPIIKNDLNGFENLMKHHFSKQSLTPANPQYKGFGITNFFCVWDKEEIKACCFVGDQKATKQYRMCSYQGIYKIVSKLPIKLLGYPAFPKANHMINHGIISYLYIKDNDPKLCSDFLRSVAAETDFDLLIWGGMEDNPLCKAMNQMKTVHYGSRLYSVEWEQSPKIRGIIGMEVGLL